MGALLDGGEGDDQLSIEGVLHAVVGMTRTVITGWEDFSSDGRGRTLTVDLSPVAQAGYELDLSTLAQIRFNNYVTEVTGSAGRDTLSGGRQADTFVSVTGDLGRGSKIADRIVDFSQADGDRIDLTGFDADSLTGGLQRFRFIGSDAFTRRAGELR